MTETRTQSTNMKAWQEPYWKIKSHYVSSLEISVAPPSALSKLEQPPYEERLTSGEFNLFESREQLGEDTEDLQFGLISKLRYCEQGIKGFTKYSEYKAKKLQKQ